MSNLVPLAELSREEVAELDTRWREQYPITNIPLECWEETGPTSPRLNLSKLPYNHRLKAPLPPSFWWEQARFYGMPLPN